MVLELHIWGPAFGLPSIDPQCLAAIAYVRLCLPAEEWVLIACSDPNLSPFGELPAVRDGTTWVARFGKIVEYVRHISKGTWDLDKGLDEGQRADGIAFTSFIESRGQPLLDLALYVSSENYTNCTRAALAEILPWPNSWTVPSDLRAKAKRRSEHLGLSSLDVDAAQENNDDEGKGLTGQIPNSLRKPKQTVTGLLGKSLKRNQFRLEAVTEDFLDPLDELLGEKRRLLGDSVSSLDCLAIGYLALMLGPELPHGWLRNAVFEKHPRLGLWARKNITEWFGPPVTPQRAWMGNAIAGDKMSPLPWRAPPRTGWTDIETSLLQNIMASLPIIGTANAKRHADVRSQDKVETDVFQSKQLALAATKKERLFYGQIAASCVGFAALTGMMVWVGLLRFPLKPDRRGRRDFGEAGAMLGLR